MSFDQVKLAELLCSRLCHDLAGPIGAVATGAELLADEDGMTGDDQEMAAEALALLAGSAAAASARLRFLRLALGGAGGATAAETLKDVAVNFLAPGSGADNLALDWSDGAAAPWEAEEAKILANLILLARDCLPRGGVIRVKARDGGASEVVAEGKGAVPGESAAALQAPHVEGLTPRGAQGFYAALAASRRGWEVSVRSVADSVTFRVG